MKPFTKMTAKLAALAALLCGIVLTAPALAEKKYGPGVTDTEIKLGQTMPYSGPVSAYGRIGEVQLAYFKYINDQGGINGRKINLISVDDGYSPPKTVEQTRRLIDSENVLALFTPMGTATTSATRQYANAKKVPQLFVSSGASKWNDPKNFPWTMGWAPNYQSEATIYARYILKEVKEPKIAILYQNDDLGKDYLEGFKKALGDRQALIVKEASYETSDPTVDSQILALQSSGANVFLNITTPKFAAQAIRKAYDIGWHPLQVMSTASASIGEVMKPAGLEKGKGVITSIYLKEVSDPSLANDKGVQEYLAWMKKNMPAVNAGDRSYVSGFSMAQTMVQVLRQCGDDLTRENLMKQAASLRDLELPMLLNGIKINTSPTSFAPITQHQLMRFDGEAFVKVGDLMSSTPVTK